MSTDKEANTSSDKPVQKPHPQVSTAYRRWIGLVCFAGIAVVIAIVKFLSLPLHFHWKLIVLGTTAFIVGSALLVWTEERKKRKWLKLMKAIFVPIILASGGLLTTSGWNERDNYNDDRALLFAAAMEWKRNDMRNVVIEAKWNLIRQEDSKTRHLFTFPTNRELKRAIDITQLERRRIQQSPLDFALLEYTDKIELLCTRLNAANLRTSRQESYRKLIDTIFGSGEVYLQYRQCHRVVEKILRIKHPGLLERVDWLQRKIIDRRMERVGELTEPVDPNGQPDDNKIPETINK